MCKNFRKTRPYNITQLKICLICTKFFVVKTFFGLICTNLSNNLIFLETLRKYPIVLALTRKSTVSYTFPNSDLTIPKDTKIYIPAYAIHRDPNIYPNPEIFDPERFNEENIVNRSPQHYLAFGGGPRNCIGK